VCLITPNYLSDLVKQVLLDKYGLFTGAKIRWEIRFDSAYQKPLRASYKVEIENQN